MKPIIKIIGKTVLGQSIDSWEFNFNDTTERVLIVGGVHGDEMEGIYIANALIEKLLNETNVSHKFLFVPCLNKDGQVLSLRSNYKDVDLNRNIPTKNWVSSYKNPRYKPGPEAGSEPETIAFMNVVNSFLPTLIISLHSFSESLILYNRGNGKFDNLVRELADVLNIKIVEKMEYEVIGSLNTYSKEHDIPTLTIEAPRDTTWESRKEIFVESLYKFLIRI